MSSSSALRLRLDRRLAGLEVDAVEVVAALDVERLRHRLAAVLLLELLGRLRPGRRGQARQRQAERQGGGGHRANLQGASQPLDRSRASGSRMDTHCHAPPMS